MKTSTSSSPNISIIVPVYNVAQYLEQCLDSLVNQTLKNIEIIIVDDGSTDGSEKTCDLYAAKYPSIKVIHQKNAGLSAARKTGMQYISGKYCGFVDSDDFVSPDYFEMLYNTAEKTEADLVQGGFTMYYSQQHQVVFDEKRTNSAIIRANGDADKLHEVMLLSPSLIWRRIYRTTFIRQHKIDFDPSVRMAEDLHFSCQTLLTAKKIACVDNPGYFYRQNRDGRLTAVGDERMMDLYWLFDKIDVFIEQNNLKKFCVFSHLAINIPLHQIKRVDENLRDQYVDELSGRLTFKNVICYFVSGIAFSVKMRFPKYFILNLICANTLFYASLFRTIKPLSHAMIKATLFFRSGNFFKFSKTK